MVTTATFSLFWTCHTLAPYSLRKVRQVNECPQSIFPTLITILPISVIHLLCHLSFIFSKGFTLLSPFTLFFPVLLHFERRGTKAVSSIQTADALWTYTVWKFCFLCYTLFLIVSNILFVFELHLSTELCFHGASYYNGHLSIHCFVCQVVCVSFPTSILPHLSTLSFLTWSLKHES